VNERGGRQAGVDLVIDEPQQIGDRPALRRRRQKRLVRHSILVVAEDVGDVGHQLDQDHAEVGLAAIGPLRQQQRNLIQHPLTKARVVLRQVVDDWLRAGSVHAHGTRRCHRMVLVMSARFRWYRLKSTRPRRTDLLRGPHTVAGGAAALRGTGLDRDRQRGGGEALLPGQPDRVAVAGEVLRVALGGERVADAGHVVETAEALAGALDRIGGRCGKALGYPEGFLRPVDCDKYFPNTPLKFS